MNEDDLIEIFRKLGVEHPESLAQSQIDNGIPELARYLFLRQAWSYIVKKGDSTWIESAIASAQAHPDGPFGAVGRGLSMIRAAGVADDEITAVVRGMQSDLLFALCYLLDDPGAVDPELRELDPAIRDIGWALVEIDSEENVVAGFGDLHDWVDDMDPMRRTPGERAEVKR